VELVGTTGWELLTTSFEVKGTEEAVVFACELRASAGEACFERDSQYWFVKINEVGLWYCNC
jgi:hypothetical protein